MSMLIGMMMTATGIALLGKVLKESIWPATNSIKGARSTKNRIIEIDEYEIVDETPNRSPGGYKVEILEIHD